MTQLAKEADTTAPITENLRAREAQRLVSPKEIKEQLPASPDLRLNIVEARQTVQNIIHGRDQRFLVVVGPCSIHDAESALEYADRLAALREEVQDKLYIVMRVYFEKPRTTVGWKGLVNDPGLDDSCRVSDGIQLGRELLIQIGSKGIPAATEFLDPIVPQYIADLISWAAIGARTTESQRHREMASGLSMPVGFKNGTDGTIDTAMNAMRSAGQPHRFLGIDHLGMSCVIETAGNPDCHVVMRGGKNGPNYQEDKTSEVAFRLSEASLPEAIMVDCSHANSSKDHNKQPIVLADVIRQRAKGAKYLVGAMLESHLNEGNQKLIDKPSELRYGVSITDACIGWDTTVETLRKAAEAL